MKLELNFLKKKYGIKNLSMVIEEIYNTVEQSMKKEKNESFDASAFHALNQSGISYAIFMSAGGDFALKNSERQIFARNKMENKFELYYWILYHEFGHVLQMNEAFIDNGKKGVDALLDEQEKEINLILRRKEAGEIEEEQSQAAYRNSRLERAADRFADHMFQSRKGEMRLHMKGVWK